MITYLLTYLLRPTYRRYQNGRFRHGRRNVLTDSCSQRQRISYYVAVECCLGDGPSATIITKKKQTLLLDVSRRRHAAKIWRRRAFTRQWSALRKLWLLDTSPRAGI